LDKTFFNDAGNKIHVDVAAGNDEAYLLVFQTKISIKQGCERNRRGTFGDGFFDLEEE
jgi:hypothetical protein